MIETFDKSMFCSYSIGKEIEWDCGIEGYKSFLVDRLNIDPFCSIFADKYDTDLRIVPPNKTMACALLEDRDGTLLRCTRTKDTLEDMIKVHKKEYPETKQLVFEHR
jgi:hypothetical protein